MKDPLDDRYVAKVANKQRTYQNPNRSNEEDASVLYRHCGCDRIHRKIEDCPAYWKKCYRCQKLNHFRSVCKADRFKKAKQKTKSVCNIEEIDRAKKPYETDTSECSDDDFVSKSSAHLFRI